MDYTNHVDLFLPGTELSELKFDGFWDWFVALSDVRVHWKNEPTYVLSQIAFVVGGIITLIHASILKGRLPYLWMATIIHGIAVESISYIHPDVDNFWHSQTPIVFLGRRFPLHIILLYPSFLYNSSVAVAKLRLPKWSEPFAVGLLVVLIDIPYDIVSVRYLHWSWHDTDPNISDRHYWVPWNSYYFHASFAASFTFWFNFSRNLCSKEEGWSADKSIFKELLCSLIPGMLGPLGGILLFIPIYHPLHDIYKIHSEVTFFILFAIFLLLAWSGDRLPKENRFPEKLVGKNHSATYGLVLHLILHYATFLAIVIFFNPEDESVTGLREPLGPCDKYVPLQTAFGMTLQKRKYLCPTDYDEGYFDWKCLPNGKPPSEGSIWYTACTIPFHNRAEYITIISLICLVALVVFWNLHFKSRGDDVFMKKVDKKPSVVKKTKKIN